MNIKEATTRWERLYMLLQGSSFRQVPAGLIGFSFGLLVAVAPRAYFWPVVAIIFAWLLIIKPLLGKWLPFSPEIRDYWRQQRERRKEHVFAFPGELIAIGVGSLLAVLTVWGVTAERLKIETPLAMGATLLSIGIIKLVVERLERRTGSAER